MEGAYIPCSRVEIIKSDENNQNVVRSNKLKSILNYSHLGKCIDNLPSDDEEVEILQKLPLC